MNIRKERKFLFDQNNFDLPETEPEPEVYIEPPPIFTLDDMGHARDEAYAKGVAAGLEQARISREQYLAEQVARVAQELKFLLGAEEYRAAVYEREAIALTDALFKTLLPYYTEREGTGEIRDVISKVLANLPDQPSIIIELPAEDAEQIETYFQSADIDLERITFKPNPALSRASCKMTWKEGGAMRDHQAIADSILNTLKLNHAPPPSPITEEPESATDIPVTEEVQPPAPPLANEDEKDETDPGKQEI